MSLRAIVPLFRRVHIGLIGGLLLALPAQAAKWAPPDPAELTDSKPRIDADAGVEMLSSELSYDDSSTDGATLEYYFRIKVYNDQGVTRLSKVEIVYDDRNARISGIEARTIKPDGTTVELSSKDIYDRVVVRSGKQRLKVKSFAPPALAAGSIVEYRYRAFRENRASFFPFPFQGEFPTRAASVAFKPFGMFTNVSLQVIFMNCPRQPLKPDSRGFYTFRMENLPARRPEPFQAPEIHLLASVLLYYSAGNEGPPEKYWASVSKALQQRTEDKAKVTKTITAKAAELVSGLADPQEKLNKLYDFCRTEILNRDRDATGLSREQLAKLPRSESAAETLKNKNGSSEDINYLFIALAKAAGFDARAAAANDRTSFVYMPKIPAPFAFVRIVAAVKAGDQWTYFEPGATYLPAGMMHWRYCDTSIAIANEKAALIEPTPGPAAAKTNRHYTANLRLSEDGTLEGAVTLTFTGYYEFEHKHALDALSKDAAEKYLKQMFEDNLKGLEISEMKIENADQVLKPLKITYQIKVPEFAERTGSRLFVQPSVFRRGEKPIFEAEKRSGGIVFPHRYGELDEVSIQLPEDYVLEEGSAPGDLKMGPAGDYKVELSWSASRHTLTYQRLYRQDVMGFGAPQYPSVKKIFEIIQERDNHLLTFKRANADASASTAETKIE